MARTLASTAAAPNAFARRRASILAAACLTLASLAGRATAAVNFPFDVRAQTITTTAPIADYVGRAVTDMNSGDRDRVMAGRQSLLAPLERSLNQSPAFFSAYSRELSEQLLAVASGKDPHAKLNAAIVAMRAGDLSHSPALSPLIAKLAADDSPSVSTFGIRAASTILLYALGNPTTADRDPLLGAIAAAVQENPESDAVVFEAYQALTTPLLTKDVSQAAGAGNVETATPRIVDAVQKLMELRLKQYAAGDIVEPAAELQGVTLLTRQQTFPICTAAQKARTVQLVAGLLDAAANQLVTTLSGGVAQNRYRAEALRNTIKGAAGGLNVVGQQPPANKSMVDASGPIKLLGSATSAADYRAAADKAVAAARAAYPAEDMPASMPATQPTIP